MSNLVFAHTLVLTSGKHVLVSTPDEVALIPFIMSQIGLISPFSKKLKLWSLVVDYQCHVFIYPIYIPSFFSDMGLNIIFMSQDLSELTKSNSGSRSRWGNKFGVLLLPVYYYKSDVDPLQYVKRAKAMIDRKKQTLEAHFSYQIGDLIMSLLGSKVNLNPIYLN